MRFRASSIVIFDADVLFFAGIFKLIHRLRGNVLVLDIHDYYPSARGQRKLRIVSMFADRVVGVSHFVLDQISVRSNTSRCVRPMVLTEAIRERPVGDFVVGIVGRVSSDKDVHRVLELSRLTSNDVVYSIRGGADASSAGYLASILVELEKAEFSNIRYEGVVERHALYDGLSALLVFNTTEPSGRVVAEAQAAGCPPIVPNSGGAFEYVEDGRSGFVYSHDDIDGLAALLNGLGQNRANSFELEQACREWVSENYSPDASAAMYAQGIAL
ncbi:MULTISPECIES: glycosyltransferase family 4 protein [Nocardiaceae]|uniref:Glycosyltransferase involved in cell wall biosynthesis n=1 Tax=Rhodococcoides corynebacterioides TaxID=53972 RepID=A0ABS2L033_9NOCA|nr:MULTISPECIES: glycosyltransferase family 4 protein [Rhodococcus]MBM7417245.1 glycosyltransferase involved in cell wall biosynthesis [Rhodococcus corynebacterioides]MBP1115498.1 glycosyltransferase involved in cell wall biosynthesis [Rhodococcus sp. PvP016]